MFYIVFLVFLTIDSSFTFVCKLFVVLFAFDFLTEFENAVAITICIRINIQADFVIIY